MANKEMLVNMRKLIKSDCVGKYKVLQVFTKVVKIPE